MSCKQLPCCNETKYKKCEDILCGDGQESQQCKISKKIKSIDCSCVVMHHNCQRDIDYGFETDEDENYIWVENECRGLFRVCHKKELECSSTDLITTRAVSNIFTSPNVVRTTMEPFQNNLSPNKDSKAESINKGLIVALPLVAVLIIMTVLILLYTRHHRRKVKKKKTDENNKQKENNTYMHNIPVDEDIVYDEITDYGQHNETESKRGSSKSGSYTDPDNKTGNDKHTRIHTCENPNYLQPGNNDAPYEEGHDYYVTPSEANYFVLEKAGDGGVKSAKQNRTPYSETAVNYFVLEKCESNSAQNNDTVASSDNKVENTDGYFILVKHSEDVQNKN